MIATEQDQGWLLEAETHRVELIDIGEGINGDFDPANPDDEPVLCLDVFRREDGGRWRLMEDAFCRTSIPVTAPTEVRQSALESVMEQVLQFGRPQITFLSATVISPSRTKAPSASM